MRNWWTRNVRKITLETFSHFRLKLIKSIKWKIRCAKKKGRTNKLKISPFPQIKGNCTGKFSARLGQVSFLTTARRFHTAVIFKDKTTRLWTILSDREDTECSRPHTVSECTLLESLWEKHKSGCRAMAVDSTANIQRMCPQVSEASEKETCLRTCFFFTQLYF